MPVQIEGLEVYLWGGIAVIGLYLWFLWARCLRQLCTTKKSVASPASQLRHSDITDIIPKASLLTGQSGMTLPPHAEEIAVAEPEDLENFEFLEDDNENLLLKEAERVVNRIQDKIDHIASNPPNPEEVTSKISAVVSQYHLFNDTEYYGAINTYIALAVERDLGIKLSSEEIKALWN